MIIFVIVWVVKKVNADSPGISDPELVYVCVYIVGSLGEILFIKYIGQ